MQIMTDVEVYGDDEGRRIFQLSAVAFDMDGRVADPHELIQETGFWFDAVTTEYPLPISKDTTDWWTFDVSNGAARAVLLRAAAERAEPLREALIRFARFIHMRLGKRGGHWANPPTFDLRIIRALYSHCDLAIPWHWKNERDMRTLMTMVKRLSPVKLPDMDGVGLVQHVGLHDAARQAVLVQAAYRALGLNAGDAARAGLSLAAAS